MSAQEDKIIWSENPPQVPEEVFQFLAHLQKLAEKKIGIPIHRRL